MQRYIQIKAADEYVTGDGVAVGAAGSGNDVVLAIEFSPLWDGLHKKIVWHDANGGNPTFTLLTPSMVDAERPNVYNVPIPYEPKAFPGEMSMSIKGRDIEWTAETATESRATLSVDARFIVKESGWDDTAEDAHDPTPDQASQLQAEIEAHVADQSNPHGVTTEQIGAIPTAEKGAPNGVAPLGPDGKIPGEYEGIMYVPFHVEFDASTHSYVGTADAKFSVMKNAILSGLMICFVGEGQRFYTGRLNYPQDTILFDDVRIDYDRSTSVSFFVEKNMDMSGEINARVSSYVLSGLIDECYVILAVKRNGRYVIPADGATEVDYWEVLQKISESMLVYRLVYLDVEGKGIFPISNFFDGPPTYATFTKIRYYLGGVTGAYLTAQQFFIEETGVRASSERIVTPLMARASALGLVKANPATDKDTQPVNINEDGFLMTAPGDKGVFATCSDEAASPTSSPNTWYVPKTMPRPSGEVGMMIDVFWVNGHVGGLGYDVDLIWGEHGGADNETIVDKAIVDENLTGEYSIPAEGTVRYQLIEQNGRKRWKYVSGDLISKQYSTDTPAATADKAVHSLQLSYLPGMEIYIQLDNGNSADVMNLVPDEGPTLPVYGNGTGATTGEIPAGYILHLVNAGDHWQIINQYSAGGGGGEVQSDWAQNDPEEVSYIKNRPGAYDDVEYQQLIPFGSYKFITGASTDAPYSYRKNCSDIREPVAGDVFSVSLDGATAEATIREPVPGNGWFNAGNEHINDASKPDTGEAFFVVLQYRSTGFSEVTVFIPPVGETTRSLAVAHGHKVPVKLPEKYLPDFATPAQLNAPVHTVMNVEFEDDGFGGYRADYNDNDINNHRNAGGLVQAKYTTPGGKTYTYYYSTMESDRKPTFIRTYIEGKKTKQVLMSVGNDKKVTVEHRTAAGGGGGGSVQSDWNQNDSTAPDYIKNRMGGYEKLSDFLATSTLTFGPNTYDPSLYVSDITSAVSGNVVIAGGDKAKVVWDGSEYYVTVTALNVNPEADIFFAGNVSIAGLPDYPDTGEPFVLSIIRSKETGGLSQVQVGTKDTGTTHTVYIGLRSIVKIPTEYLALPDPVPYPPLIVEEKGFDMNYNSTPEAKEVFDKFMAGYKVIFHSTVSDGESYGVLTAILKNGNQYTFNVDSVAI